MGITSPSFSGGAGIVTSDKIVSADLEIDGTTIVVDETNNRVGVGTGSPGVQLDVHDTTTSSANTGGALRLSANDGAAMGDSHRLGVIEFTGAEDSSGTQTVGARIEAMTDAAWTNAENGGALYFYTTDGNASQTNVLKLDSNKKATFAGKIQGENGSVSLKEKAAADADTAAYGQLWCKTATPNELYFTTDAGNDIQLTTGTGTAGGSAPTTMVMASVIVTDADKSDVDADDYYILMNTAGSGTTTRTVTLPENSAAGTTFVIKDIGGAAGTANIAVARTGSDTIDGQTSQVINSNYASVTLVSSGANWFIV